MDTNRNSLYTKNKFWAGALLAQFLLFFLLSKSNIAIKAAENFFEIKKFTHQKLFSGFNFSAGDLLYIVLLSALIYLLINIFRKKHRRKNLNKLLILLNIFYFLYQIMWGMLYFQPPLIEKLSGADPTAEDAKQTALKYLEICIRERNTVQEDKNGVFKMWNADSVHAEILQRQNYLPSEFSQKKSSKVELFKPALWGKMMSYSGIAGYYNPFTAEAQYNPGLPSTALPFTLAHESAHQLGYAREQEANFIAYLIGKDSNNAELRYSTHYYVLRSLLASLQQTEPEFVKSVIVQYSAGMKRDRLYEKNYAAKYSGPSDAFFALTNDLFLKSNQQEGSITYSYFVDLLLRYEAQKKNRVSQHDSKNTNDEKKFIAITARPLSKAG